jgi:hypothetical protein
MKRLFYQTGVGDRVGEQGGVATESGTEAEVGEKDNGGIQFE